MPNYCSNRLVIEHEDRAKLQEFCEAFNDNCTCNHFLPPVFPEYPDTVSMKDASLDRVRIRIETWGTKWDFGVSESNGKAEIDGNTVKVCFSTVWSPPIGLYKKLEELGFGVCAGYYEAGEQLCGMYEDGVDTCYKSFSEIPAGIVEAFGIEFEEE